MMIEIADLTLGYGPTMLINGATAYFNRGTLTALVGLNGSGKSTLLRALATLNPSYSGTITVGSHDLRTLHPVQASRLIGYVGTRKVEVPYMTVADLVATGRAPYTGWDGTVSRSDRDMCRRALETVGIQHMAARKLQTLSDGERQRAMIARAIAQNTPAILLDEPTSFLDIPNRLALAALLQHLAEGLGKTIIFSTHELQIALAYAHNIACLHNGQLLTMPPAEFVASGLPEKVFGPEVARFMQQIGSWHLTHKP